VASAARASGAGTLVLTGMEDSPVMQDMQVREARSSGLRNVVAGKVGMMIELPLTSQDVRVRAL
jgi:hypothetical protein